MLAESDVAVPEAPPETGWTSDGVRVDGTPGGSYTTLTGPIAHATPWAGRFFHPGAETPALGWLGTCELVVLQSLEDVRQMVAELLEAPYVTFDTETTGLRVIDDHIVALQWAGSPTRGFFAAIDMLDARFTNLSLPAVLATCAPLAARGYVAHNASYDWKMCVQEGTDFTIVADTRIESKLYDVNRRSNLKDCMRDLLGLDEVIKFKSLFAPKTPKRFDNVKYDVAVPYACQDPLGTWQLHAWFLQHGVNPQDFIYQLEHALIKPIAEMELLGVQLDQEKIATAKAEAEKAMADAMATIVKIAGRTVELTKPDDVAKLLYQELQLPVLKMTPSGNKPSTDVKTLNLLKAKTKHPIIEAIETYREFEKLKVAFLDPLPGFVQRDGCIHTSIDPLGADSGRMSNKEPNLQQVPKKKGDRANDGLRDAIRSSFLPPPGFVGFIDIDYSQIEYVLFACLSRDQGLMQAFLSGVDVHKQTASLLLGIPLDQVDKPARGRGKTLNFAAIYGQGAKALAETLGISEWEAQQLQQLYWSKMQAAAMYCQQLRDFAHQHGYCETFFGRKRQLPSIHSTIKWEMLGAERQAVNSPIQGAAADLMKIAIVRAHAAFKERGFKSRMTHVVHDALVTAFHPDDNLDEVMETLRWAMEDIPDPSWNWVPTLTEVEVGPNWGSVQKTSYRIRRKPDEAVPQSLLPAWSSDLMPRAMPAPVLVDAARAMTGGDTSAMIDDVPDRPAVPTASPAAPPAALPAAPPIPPPTLGIQVPQVSTATDEVLTILVPQDMTPSTLESLALEVKNRPGPIPLRFDVNGTLVQANRGIMIDRRFLLQLQAEGIRYTLSDALARRMMRVA